MPYHFFALISRMRYIGRWGLMRNTMPENDMEHALQTGLIAHAMAVMGNRRYGRNYQPEYVLALAVYHDSCEVITGDLPTPIKYKNPAIQDAYQEIEFTARQQLLDMLPEDMRRGFAPYLQPDETSVEWKLVKAADRISAYLKCVTEEKLGNREFLQAKETIWKSLQKSDLPEVEAFLKLFVNSFTMSLDDFVITHFTKGPGIDTLSTKIYSEVRKGIRPEIYALSTIMFVTVLFLLFLVNLKPEKEVHEKGGTIRKPSRARHTMRLIVTRVVPALLVIVITAGGFFYNSKTKISGAEKVIVYNWGEYLDPDVLDIFEEETGIQVVYEEYETNEIMYPKVQSGAISYDVVCPSDYMIQRMIENDLLAEINWDNIPNIKNIGQTYMDQSKAFDPENKYSVPYCWGTVGILYNKTMVDEPIDSWSVLWDPKYKDSILMQDSVRDAFGVTLKYLGYSLNSTDLDELNEAKNLLIRHHWFRHTSLTRCVTR